MYLSYITHIKYKLTKMIFLETKMKNRIVANYYWVIMIEEHKNYNCTYLF